MQSKLIQRIESKRIELGLSIKQLSEKSGVPESTYSNIISGRSQNPSYDRLRILAVSVDLSPVEFMDAIDGGKNTPETDSLQKEVGKVATGYDLDYLADTFVRVNDQFANDFRIATQSRNEEFQRALRSKDEQFERERETYLATIASKDRWIKTLFITCLVLGGFICSMLLIDVLNPNVGWFRTVLSQLLTRNNLV